MRFNDITGHRKVIALLKDMVDSGKIPHAILLHGPEGVGKLNVARAFSQYIHCKNRQNGDACGMCPACLQHKDLNNPDTHFVYPVVKKESVEISKNILDIWKEALKENKFLTGKVWNEYIKAGNSQPTIYVKESDDILEKASVSAYQENYKIFMIWQPEKMRNEAANKLLKIIEEPFEDTLFILVSNEPSKLLPTIISRTRQISFSQLPESDISLIIQKELGVSEEAADDLAQLAEGNAAKAFEIAMKPEEISEFTEMFKEIMRAAYGVQGRKIKDLSEKIASYGREKLIRFLNYSARMVRENFIRNYSMPQLNHMTQEEEIFSVKFSPYINGSNVEGISEEIGKAVRDIERNGNAKIIVFDFIFLLSQWLRKKV